MEMRITLMLNEKEYGDEFVRDYVSAIMKEFPNRLNMLVQDSAEEVVNSEKWKQVAGILEEKMRKEISIDAAFRVFVPGQDGQNNVQTWIKRG